MGNTRDTGYLRNIIAYDASNNITLPARLAVTGTVAVNNTTPYDTTQFSLDVNGGLIVKNINKTAQFVLINSNPASGGNNAFVVHTVGGTSASSYADIQGYYGTSIAGSTVIRLNPQGGNVLVGSLAGTGSRMVVADTTGVLSTQTIPTLGELSGVPTSRTLTINGVSYDLSANRSWSALPVGGIAGQLLAKVDGTDYNAQWVNEAPAASYTSQLKHVVKAGAAINKGQAVYVSSSDGTNMIVNKASNASEQTSSKTLGLLETTVSNNGFTNVITEGLLAGLDTTGANAAGDPVWLGTDGNLIYGLLNKPSAPAHLVFIGVVTRRNANNGEIFIKVQNGFEMGELHDYVQNGVLDNYVISYESSTSLYKPKSIATLLGYTPANATRTITINGTTQDLSADRTFTINSMVYPGAGIAVSTGTAWGTSLTDNSSNWNTAFGWGNHASAGYATTTYVGTQIANLVASSPAALDTLNELAAALGNDAAFSTTVSTALGNRLRVDINTQGLSATLQGYGRTNLGLGTAATSNTGDFAAASHTHSIVNVTGLQTALDGKQASLGFTPYNSTNPSGYISSYTETSTLANVTSRGASTSTAVTFSGGASISSLLINGATTWTEGSLALGAMGTTEGGQLVLNKATSHTYAAHLDVWQDTFRVLYGTNTASSGNALSINLSTRQLILPQYNASNVFTGTAAGVLAFDSSGNILTIAVPGGAVSSVNAGTGVSVNQNTGAVTVSIGQSVATSATPSFDQVITSNNGNGTNFRIGDDVWIGDINAANTFRIQGVQNAANAYIVFGNGDTTALGRTGTGALTYGGNTIYHAGNLPTIPTNNNQLTNGAGYLTSYTETDPTVSATAKKIIDSAWAGTSGYPGYSFTGGNSRFGFSSSAGAIDVYADGNFYATDNGYLVLHTNNYSSYALPTGGGTMTGQITWSSGSAPISFQQGGNSGTYTQTTIYANQNNTSGDDGNGIFIERGYTNTSNTEIRKFIIGVRGGGVQWRLDGPGNVTQTGGLTATYLTTSGEGNFGPDSGGNNGIRIRYGNVNGGYGMIRFMQDGTNYNTIHSFSSLWQGGSFISASAGAINISGQYGVTFGGWNTADAHISADALYVKAWATPSGSTGWNANSVLRLQQGSTGNNVYIEMRNRADVGDHAAILFTDNNVGGYIGFRTYASNDLSVGSDCMIYGSYNDHIFQSGASGVFNGKGETFRIYANGSVRATGDITAYSDRRVKENIITIDKALEKTLQLRGVFYNRTDKDDKSQKVGVIAQEIQEILPQVVNEDYNGLLSVSYGNITGLLIEAVKEQQTQIESQKSEIDELKDLVKQLINR